jgi:hypothetical protein
LGCLWQSFFYLVRSCKSCLVPPELPFRRRIILSKKSVFEFKAILVYYAVGFLGKINHLRTFATFLGGRRMSVVQGLPQHGAKAPLVPPKVGMARRRRPTCAAQPPP